MTVIERSALLEVPIELAYGVVVDVARYPEFVPACRKVVVREEFDDGLIAEVAVQGRGIKEFFVTRNTHRLNERVTMLLQEGPFEVLQGHWQFTALGNSGCRVNLHIEFTAKGLLIRMLGKFADRIADRLVDAFSTRMLQQVR